MSLSAHHWILGVTFDLISDTPLWVATANSSNMQEPAAEDNLAFEETAGTTTPAPLGIQSKLAKKGFVGERRASELTESVLRYNRRDQHLAHVSSTYLKSLSICCALPVWVVEILILKLCQPWYLGHPLTLVRWGKWLRGWVVEENV